MANVKFNKKTFEKEIGKLSEEMQNKIALFGTTVESISDEEIEIDVTPNRPDLLSYQGFKRSFLGFLGKQKGLKEYKTNKPEKDYQVIIDKSVKDIRPYTACAIVKNLNFDDEKIKEIIDIQEKLHFTVGRKRKKAAIGIYPLEKIKLPITFMALEPDKIKFIPLETEKEMSGLQILQRHPTGRDYAHLLAGKEKFPIFIDAENKILSMPPIINSHLTGKITKDTKEIFIECSGFDFQILKKILNILVAILSDMGGKIYQMELKNLKETTPNMEPEKMQISAENANKLLGLNLNEKQIKELLEKMGYNYKNKFVEIPSWRTDILHEVDLIEDIAIAYGYENFVPEIPQISTIGKEDKKETIKRKIGEILAGLGMLETSNYHLTNKEDQFEKMGVQEKNSIRVEESKTDYNLLRNNLTHYAMKIFSENVDVEYPQKIFEIGKTFEIENEKIKENENLAAAITPGNFTEIKQILDYLSRMMDVNLEIKEPAETPHHFIDGRCGEIKIRCDVHQNSSSGEGGLGVEWGNKNMNSQELRTIGFVGEINPRTLKNWKMKMPVALFEISLEEIFEEMR